MNKSSVLKIYLKTKREVKNERIVQLIKVDMSSDLGAITNLPAMSGETVGKNDISPRILRLLSVANHSAFRSRRALHKSVSVN